MVNNKNITNLICCITKNETFSQSDKPVYYKLVNSIFRILTLIYEVRIPRARGTSIIDAPARIPLLDGDRL